MAIIGAYMVPHPPLIVPEVGHGGENQIVKTRNAYNCVAQEIAKLEPETIIISSPHATMYSNYFNISNGKFAKGSFAKFKAPQVQFEEKYDEDLVNTIENIAQLEDFPAGTLNQNLEELDHGTMVPLYFIEQFYSNFKLVRIGLSGLPLESHYRMGSIIKRSVEKLEYSAVYIASGDLSHKLKSYGPYGFTKEGPQYDKLVMDICKRAAFDELLKFDTNLCERAAECGHRSFVMMAGALDGMCVEAKQLSYEDITGVGYGICSFRPTVADISRKFLEKHKKNTEQVNFDPLVNLAKKSIESYVCYGKTIDVPEGLPTQLTNTRAGTFVSIHKNGKLRGCTGTIVPTKENLAKEIIHNAISASSCDSRFTPIEPSEIKFLEINVDVLSEPENIDSELELDVKRYGVIVTKDNRRGVLLPDIDGIDTVDQQVSIAKQKAGIDPDEKVTLQRFEVIRHT